jgi:hypothetical protein
MRVHDITGPVYGFVCIQTGEPSSQNLAGVTCDDNVHKAMAVTVFNCAVDATHGALVQECLAPSSLHVLVCHPDSSTESRVGVRSDR